MKRREFLLSMAALAAGCSSDESSNTPNLPNSNLKPNILFIAIDDLNDWVGFLGGHPQVKTPNIDKLASRSIVFDKAYCNAPLCGPSRASLLSGCYPYVTKVFDHSHVNLPSNLVDLPTYFSKQGYEVLLKGKIFHVFKAYPTALPNKAPFTNLKCSGTPNLPPEGLFDWAGLDVNDQAIGDGQLAQDGIKYLAANHDKPFFLGLGFMRTHLPWYVPEKYYDLYPLDSIQIPRTLANDWDDLPYTGLQIANAFNFQSCIEIQNLWKSAVRGYLASISFVDEQIGILINALDKSVYAHNTIVVLWSDNGFHLGEKFHWHKMALWEESTRIPLLIYNPMDISGAKRISKDVSLIDIFPTLMDLCELDKPAQLQGHSLVPLIKNPNELWSHPVLTTYLKNHHAIRAGQWCYIKYEDGGEELYDRYADKYEFFNLANTVGLSDIKAKLRNWMPPIIK